jgi:hypothetical protein
VGVVVSEVRRSMNLFAGKEPAMPAMYDRDKLHVGVALSDGDLLISGHDLNGFLDRDEYEYWITVPASQFPAIRDALGADATADVVSLMVAHAEQIVTRGERTWLAEHGIECRLHTYP